MHSKKKIKRIQTHNLRWEFQVTLLLLIAIGNKLRKTNLSRKLGTDVQMISIGKQQQESITKSPPSLNKELALFIT